jgi:hypothetical protein
MDLDSGVVWMPDANKMLSFPLIFYNAYSGIGIPASQSARYR